MLKFGADIIIKMHYSFMLIEFWTEDCTTCYILQFAADNRDLAEVLF